jgi:hypothetical protein
MIQITQNSISSHTIGVKIMKSPSGNPTHQELSNKTKGALQFPLKKINFDFVEFFDKITQYSITPAPHV